MEREQHDDLIDLGVASIETLGGPGAPLDEIFGQVGTGLSDD